MTTHKAEVRIDAPKEAVWEALADFSGVWKYNPSVESSHSLTTRDRGVGAERRCELTFGGAAVEERIVDWNPAGHYTVEIFGGDRMPPIRRTKARLGVRADGDGSIVTGAMTYETKLGPIGALMNRLVIRKKFGGAFSGMFAGLKHHVETGETVGEDTKLAYDAVTYAATT
ncbi:MAG: SRPBCC family protein [Gaiellaceae bacterium]